VGGFFLLTLFFIMSLGIDQNILYFDIYDSDMNPKTFIIFDKSYYMDKYPNNPIMDVTPPGFMKAISLPFIPREYNIINTGNLKLACGEIGDLPDGIYTFRLSLCPNEIMYVCKTYLRTTLLEYKFHSLLLSCECVESEDSDRTKKILMNIDILIQSAKANAERGNILKATSMYAYIEKMINRLNCK